MFVYLFMYLLVNYRRADALPIPIDRGDATQVLSAPKRTLFGVTWNCISTIIICAWTSVHPNVPPPNKWKARWSRLRLMFWMIIAPELVLAWAVRQLFAAMEIRDTFNKCHPDLPMWKKWTLMHGHFFEMGGFRLVDPARKDVDPRAQNGTVLTFDYFKENPNIDIPDISVNDIKDRSKGDILFKLIAILQTSWFIVQCVARGYQRLALAELELVTLALASLNAVTFAIWWHKPLGVQEPVKIYLKTEVPKDANAGRQEERNLSFGDVISKGWKIIRMAGSVIHEFLKKPCELGLFGVLFFLFIFFPFGFFYTVSFPFFVLFPWGITLLLRIIEAEPIAQESSQSRGLLAARLVASLQQFRYSLSSVATKFVEEWLRKIFDDPGFLPFFFGWFFVLPSLFVLLFLFTILLTPFLILLFLISFIFTAVFGIVTTSTVHPGASHVPSFYALITKSDRWSRMVVFALFGFIFGGLHCIGWHFEFPTHAEQTLWQATSFAITFIPLIVAPIDFLLASRDINSYQGFKHTSLLILDFIMTIFLFIYVPARLSLIAQAFALLRAQPPSALVPIDWTKCIPHIFS